MRVLVLLVPFVLLEVKMSSMLIGFIAYVLMTVCFSAAALMETGLVDGLRMIGLFAGIAAFAMGIYAIKRYLDGYDS